MLSSLLNFDSGVAFQSITGRINFGLVTVMSVPQQRLQSSLYKRPSLFTSVMLSVKDRDWSKHP